jgi:hypothetical protein
MVKQARGTLPTVQPLTAPRFAPVAGAFIEAFAETEAAAQAMEDGRRERPHPRPDEAREDREDRAPAGSEDAWGGRDRSSLPMRSGEEPQSNRARAEKPDARPEPGKVRERATASAGQPEETGPAETGEPAIRAAAIEARREAPVQSARVERRRPESDEGGGEIASRASRAPLGGQERAEPAMEVRDGARRDAAERAGAAAEQRTEIHISIGSIELRAPRAESRPAALPFRPRVTLDDFLSRKPEAGR